MNEFMRWAIPAALLLSTTILLIRKQWFSPEPFSKLQSLSGLLFISWFLLGFVAQLQGGTAISGDVRDSRFFLRHHPSSIPIEVSSEYWVTSLCAEFLVIGLVPFLIAVSLHYSNPPWARGLLTRGMTVFGVLWGFAIAGQTLSLLARWAAA